MVLIGYWYWVGMVLVWIGIGKVLVWHGIAMVLVSVWYWYATGQLIGMVTV